LAKSLSFSPYVASKVDFYVYRLIDPRTGTTFYVGKGQGNRVFSHAAGELQPSENQEKASLKLNLIYQIKTAGFEVEHIIHRHGMSEGVAKEVEAALIDAYAGLTNLQGGYNSDHGAMHALEVIRLYETPIAEFLHNCLLINVNNTSSELPLLDATRYAWKVSVNNAKACEYILAVRHGVIIGAFVADEWLPATPENFPGFPAIGEARYGFRGREAPDDICRHYEQKRIPPQAQGAQNPIRYVRTATT
jgi:hypothetical protein